MREENIMFTCMNEYENVEIFHNVEKVPKIKRFVQMMQNFLFSDEWIPFHLFLMDPCPNSNWVNCYDYSFHPLSLSLFWLNLPLSNCFVWDRLQKRKNKFKSKKFIQRRKSIIITFWTFSLLLILSFFSSFFLFPFTWFFLIFLFLYFPFRNEINEETG